MLVAYKNFTGGEVSPSMRARYDLNKFASTCRYMENFLPELHGPLVRRPGTYFLEDLGAPAVLLPFKFSSDPTQNFVLVVQEGRTRVAGKGGFVRGADGKPVVIATPWTAEQLYDLSYAQSADVLYIAHPAHPLQKIIRTSNTSWSIAEPTFLPSIGKPAAVTVEYVAGPAASGQTRPDADYTITYKVAAVSDKGEVGFTTLGSNAAARHTSDWITGDHCNLSWSAVPDAKQYCIYRLSGGYYGLIGVSETTSFRDDKYSADTSDTPPEPRNPFKDGNNPALVTFHQQRLVLGSPAKEPQTWYASCTGRFEDMSKSKPLRDDDSLEFTIASGRVDAVQWMASFGDLIIGTSGCELKAVGSDQGVLTPTSLNMREQSAWGSLKLPPLLVGNAVLHVQRQGSRVRDLTYSLEKDGYSGNDLSVMAAHLFNNHVIKQWDYQQAPGSRVWAVRDDGMLLVMTYLKEHDVYGWSRATTQGRFRSVCSLEGVLEDVLFVVAEREVGGKPKWYLELLQPQWDAEIHGIRDAFFVDSGLSYNNPDEPVTVVHGLGHLEGLKVDILAEGAPEPQQTVVDGKVTLAAPAGVVHVGLPYVSVFCPQTPEADTRAGATLSRVRSYGRSSLYLASSVTGKYGTSRDKLFAIPVAPAVWDAPIEPARFFYEFSPLGNYSPHGDFWLVQDLPLPFTLAALVFDVDFQS
jgi:hypothetical protein